MSRPSTDSTAIPTKPTLSVSSTALISDKATFTGSHPINISTRVIIHPFARIDSSAGPIDINEGAVVWERAVIGGKDASSQAVDGQQRQGQITRIGRNASVGPCTSVLAGASVGVNVIIGVNCVVHVGANIGDYVTLSPFVVVVAGEIVEDYMTLFMLGDKVGRRKGIMAASTEVDDELTEGGGDDVGLTVKVMREKAHDREMALLRKTVKAGVKWTS